MKNTTHLFQLVCPGHIEGGELLEVATCIEHLKGLGRALCQIQVAQVDLEEARVLPVDVAAPNFFQAFFQDSEQTRLTAALRVGLINPAYISAPAIQWVLAIIGHDGSLKCPALI